MTNGSAVWVLMVVALNLAGISAVHAQSPQEIYNGAQAAFDKQDWNAAIAGFERIVPPPPRRLSQSQAVIASRLGYALLQKGRFEEARGSAERAIAALPAAAADGLTDALLIAGQSAHRLLDYDVAAADLRRAKALAIQTNDPDARTFAIAELALTLITVDPAAAGAELDTLFADPAAMVRIKGDQLAIYQDLRARAAMNAGDFRTAQKWADRAVGKADWLTEKVTMTDIVARTDAAIVYGLLHDDENTRRFMAFTGAGHLKDINWVPKYDGELPVCSRETGINPQDTVIVWFAIAADGHVYGVEPIYASHAGTLGETFARTVSSWNWNPDLIAKVDPFWRNALVIQLRCQSRPAPEGLDKPFRVAFGDWLESKGVSDRFGDHASYVGADDPRLTATDLTAVPALLGRLAQSGDKPFDTAPIHRLLDANQAPAAAYAVLLDAEARHSLTKSAPQTTWRRAQARALGAGIVALDAKFAGDPAIAWLRLEQALALEGAGAFADAAPLLRKVEATPEAVLPATAPIRRVALLHEAIVARRLKQASDGDAKLAAAGVTADQCSLFDTRPLRSGGDLGSGDFPIAAMRWGFEGVVREAFDIDDNGHLKNVRTVFAYPPFIFAPTTETAIKALRYEPPRIGGKAVGCTSQMQSVRFTLPNR
jgi:outer membrane biosynthesis protein TonB